MAALYENKFLSFALSGNTSICMCVYLLLVLALLFGAKATLNFPTVLKQTERASPRFLWLFVNSCVCNAVGGLALPHCFNFHKK